MLNNSLDQIDLCVNVEVCKVNLTLEKLLHLQIGDVVETNVVPAAVKLVVNGQIIAEGFLVKVNDKSGVRITKLYQEDVIQEDHKSHDEHKHREEYNEYGEEDEE